MRTFKLTHFRNIKSTDGSTKVYELPDLMDLFRHHEHRNEKDGPCFLPGEVDQSGRRRKENVLFIDVLGLDFDHEFDLQALKEHWKDLYYVIVTTYSHTSDKPRIRAYFPLFRSVQAEEWERFAPTATAFLSLGRADNCGADLNRVWLLPSCSISGSADAFADIHEGRLLDPDDYSTVAVLEPVRKCSIDWKSILEPAGWTPSGHSGNVIHWSKPGADGKLSATTDYIPGRLFVFSTNASPFQPRRPYSMLEAYALLNCNGNISDAERKLGIDDKKTSKKNQGSFTGNAPVILAGIGEALNLRFFRNHEQNLYVQFIDKELLQFVALDSLTFRDTLLNTFFETHHFHPGADAISKAIDLLRMKARDVPAMNFEPRILHWEGSIYLNLANQRGEVVKIDSDGWEIMPNPGVPFPNLQAGCELPAPLRDPDVTASDLAKFCNLDEVQVRLVTSALVGWFFTKSAVPHLFIQGSQGSAKSTTAKNIRALIDPSVIGGIELRNDEREIMGLFSVLHIPQFDNLSHISSKQSDILCKLSTDGSFLTRALYTNSGLAVASGRRPAILTAINNVIQNPDLQSRCLILHLSPLGDDLKPEVELEQEFQRLRPGLLALILDGVVLALRNRETFEVRTRLRLVDFVRNAMAAAPAFGWTGHEILTILEANANEAVTDAGETNFFVTAMQALVEEKKTFSGTPTEICEALNQHWPDSRRPIHPTKFYDHCQKYKPLLEARSIFVKELPRTSSKRSYLIEKKEFNPVMPSFEPRLEGDSANDTSSSPDIDDTFGMEGYDPFDDSE